MCCVLYSTKEQANTIKTKKQVRKKYKERTREEIQKKKSKPVEKKFSGPGAHPVPYIISTGALSRG